MNRATTIVKIRANYTCQECGSTEYAQGHHIVPKDDSTLICLCGECHSQKHPDVPKQLFFLKSHQPYWHNKSAATLARQWGICSRTVIRAARRIGILSGTLSSLDEEALKRNINKANIPIPHGLPIPRGTTIQFLRSHQTNANTLLTVQEATTIFHLHTNTLRRYLNNGDIHSVRLEGRWRIPWRLDNNSGNFPELCKPQSCNQ